MAYMLFSARACTEVASDLDEKYNMYQKGKEYAWKKLKEGTESCITSKKYFDEKENVKKNKALAEEGAFEWTQSFMALQRNKEYKVNEAQIAKFMRKLLGNTKYEIPLGLLSDNEEFKDDVNACLDLFRKFTNFEDTYQRSKRNLDKLERKLKCKCQYGSCCCFTSGYGSVPQEE